MVLFAYNHQTKRHSHGMSGKNNSFESVVTVSPLIIKTICGMWR